MICCCVVSFKTLVIPARDHSPSAAVNVSAAYA